MPRILLHPGFHKTGTSSLQRGAAQVQRALRPHLRLIFTHDLIEATRMAKRFSAYREQSDLRRFAEAFTATIRDTDPDEPRALMITSEDLCGYIPGNHGVTSYAAAAPLMNVATAVLAAHFGPEAPIGVLFTTRAPRDWQRSVWWQNLRALRVTEDFETYRTHLSSAADLDTIVDSVDERVRHRATVLDAPIEECGTDPLGPLGVALDHLDVPRDGLAPLPAHNVQPDGAAEELLALNRSALSDAELSEAKRAVLKRYRAAGATRQTRTTPA
ncbi:hypothetical protein PVV74_09035 [Roseovarius sp. SK2]|uniref:hypothetical protein n=1 Tax=Roseovarius TaxID=74030 RepID=UPI00237B1485|nr:hypothetical protein [Roseovarius sp. SK2]MDD9725596.1 hypothetical protein [Roseovarius sp. SK2]